MQKYIFIVLCSFNLNSYGMHHLAKELSRKGVGVPEMVGHLVRGAIAASYCSNTENDGKNSQLLDACRAGNLEQVISLVREGANVRMRDGDQNSLFHRYPYNKEILEFLTKHEDINDTNLHCDTPLVHLLKYGFNLFTTADYIQWYKACGGDLNKGCRQDVPLNIVLSRIESFKRRGETVPPILVDLTKELLIHNASISKNWKQYRWASRLNHEETLTYIMPSPLFAAAAFGNLIDLQRYAERDEPSQIDENGLSVFHLAAARGHADVILELSSPSCWHLYGLKYNGKTPREFAIMNGHQKTAQLIQDFQNIHRPRTLGFGDLRARL
ncbi:MAG TPA: ankyrin repeat domain-containing protein [Candidatus Babeliaceae bacterium]|nr:ankyrin repeat domain-containing protein [Candidatus Babeliaceae bacterium]